MVGESIHVKKEVKNVMYLKFMGPANYRRRENEKNKISGKEHSELEELKVS